MVTLQDIADRTGFSRAVVSRALNPHPDQKVAAKTLEIVRKTAAEMGYRRNQAASLLAKGASPAIGIFLPFHQDELICAMLKGMCNVANQHGFAYNIYNERRRVEYSEFAQTLRNTRNAGVITYLPFETSGDSLPEEVSRLLPQSCQIVVANARTPIKSGNVESVMIDNYAGGALAAEHLLQKKCVRFLYEYAARSWQRQERCRSFVEHINHAGFEARHFAYLTDEILESVIDEVLSMILAGPFPVGVFCNTDRSALRLYAELCRAGKAGLIGKEIKICGFDNITVADKIGLTSIAQPFEALGEAAMSLLVNRLTGSNIPVEHCIKPVLCPRLTT